MTSHHQLVFLRLTLKSLFMLAFGSFLAVAQAAPLPKEVRIGTLYADSGPFATSSMSQFQGLQFWVNEVNRKGGIYIKAYRRKIPVKLIAYNDRSSTTTAATLYNQLITQDRVDILAADFGSVLTSVAVPIAEEHKMLLFDQSGTGASFFTKDNPYIVLTSLPTSAIWPYALADYLKTQQQIKRAALIYATNDFTGSQADTLRERLKGSHVDLVYDQGVPTSTSNYTVLLHNIEAARPDAVIEFGYPNNDLAFQQDLRASGMKFNMLFTIFPGQLFDLFRKNIGSETLAYKYTYPTPPLLVYNKVNYGMGLDTFQRAFRHANQKDANFLNIAGYNAGLVIQKSLETATSMEQLALRRAVENFSGKLHTLDGPFRIDPVTGAQIGENLPVGQFIPDKQGLGVRMLYPPELANGKAVYPAP
ncbi:MAG: ABC transporter substrate-binding protein [Acidiferrobacterales bacterium]